MVKNFIERLLEIICSASLSILSSVFCAIKSYEYNVNTDK